MIASSCWTTNSMAWGITVGNECDPCQPEALEPYLPCDPYQPAIGISFEISWLLAWVTVREEDRGR